MTKDEDDAGEVKSVERAEMRRGSRESTQELPALVSSSTPGMSGGEPAHVGGGKKARPHQRTLHAK